MTKTPFTAPSPRCHVPPPPPPLPSSQLAKIFQSFESAVSSEFCVLLTAKRKKESFNNRLGSTLTAEGKRVVVARMVGEDRVVGKGIVDGGEWGRFVEVRLFRRLGGG